MTTVHPQALYTTNRSCTVMILTSTHWTRCQYENLDEFERMIFRTFWEMQIFIAVHWKFEKNLEIASFNFGKFKIYMQLSGFCQAQSSKLFVIEVENSTERFLTYSIKLLITMIGVHLFSGSCMHMFYFENLWFSTASYFFVWNWRKRIII